LWQNSRVANDLILPRLFSSFGTSCTDRHIRTSVDTTKQNIPYQAKMSSNANSEDRPGHCMVDAWICCYTACDWEDFVCCCKCSGDCLCLRCGYCLAVGADSLVCGMTTNAKKGECCKIGLGICECGLVNPQVLCMYAEQCMCCQRVGALPFHDDYLPECVCAYYFIQCAPECGCCVKPPHCEALKLVKTAAPVTASAMSRE
jgi:hypothetical protein